jgi:hypothetical protein
MIVFFIFQSSFSLEQKAGAATEISSVTVSVPHHAGEDGDCAGDRGTSRMPNSGR